MSRIRHVIQHLISLCNERVNLAPLEAYLRLILLVVGFLIFLALVSFLSFVIAR